MASKNGQLQYIVVDNFSPGIWANRYSGGAVQPAPHGAAQLTNTYGCVSDPSGALVPGPLLHTTDAQFTETLTNLSSPWDGTHAYGPFAKILGLKVVGPVYSQPVASQPVLTNTPDYVAVAYQYFYDPTGASNFNSLRTKVFIYKINQASPFGIGDNSFDPTGVTSYSPFSQTNAGVQAPPIVSAFSYTYPYWGSVGMDVTRANNAAPTSAGSPVLFGAYFPAWVLSGSGATWAFPKNSTPTVDSNEALGFTTIGNASVQAVFAHQDRIVGVAAIKSSASVTNFGANAYTDPSDYIEFLNINNYSASSGTLVVDSEAPTGYGSWQSMNASTLVMIKKHGGAVIISGPLEQPTITKMPGVPGTGQHSNLGCTSPSGEYIYGSTTGVYAWSGGNSARLISPNFDGAFWIDSFSYTNGETVTGPRASFASSEQYLFSPNNFLMDWNTGAWWRYSNSTTAANTHVWHDVSSNGMIVAAPGSVSSGNYSFVYIDPRAASTTSYSWQSQPFAETVNREIAIREVNLTYTGGPFTVTIGGVNNSSVAVTQSETFAANTSGMPKTLSISTFMSRWDATVRIVGNGNVYRVSLGYHEEETAR